MLPYQVAPPSFVSQKVLSPPKTRWLWSSASMAKGATKSALLAQAAIAGERSVQAIAVPAFAFVVFCTAPSGYSAKIVFGSVLSIATYPPSPPRIAPHVPSVEDGGARRAVILRARRDDRREEVVGGRVARVELRRGEIAVEVAPGGRPCPHCRSCVFQRPPSLAR